ncbi:MAG TPA: BatA domain-containing protein, partial [Bacteroidales bacterium]|nr:BatA domain-containing protein [Bacteroidales bacterium]
MSPFKTLTFANPGAFFLLLLIPLLVAWYIYRQKRYTADMQISTGEGFAGVGRNLRFY